MKKDGQDIGEFFRDAFDGFEPEVTGNPWQQIESQLQANGLQSAATSSAAKGGLFGSFGVTAAVIVGSALVGAAIFYAVTLGPDETPVVADKTPTTQTNTTETAPVPEEVIYEKINTNLVIEELKQVEETPVGEKVKKTVPSKEAIQIKAPEKSNGANASAANSWITPTIGNTANTNPTGVGPKTTETPVEPKTSDDLTTETVLAATTNNDNSSAVPVPIIDASTLEGFAPLTVDFYNQNSQENQYYWSFGDGSVSFEASPEHTYLKPGVYTVTLEIINKEGVSATTVELIEVKEVSSFEYDVAQVPNVLTPNGDGMNDRFIVPGIQGKNVKVSISIYNSAQAMMYTSNILEEGWDGNDLRGNPAPEGTYFFIIVVQGTDGNLKRKINGNLTLLR